MTNWFIIKPLQYCETHDKPYLSMCYKCLSTDTQPICASELDCKTCRAVFRSWLPFPDDVSEFIVRFIAKPLSQFHGNCSKPPPTVSFQTINGSVIS